ncbi:MAG: SUMF1/EgtB/PvdO family nonheme iron enzyme, partial [Bacteroidales bacterium]|nr:SUMF1/EgtB/PvdO family nonheme iron enzyme [Bacteroidales bacterium]
MAFTLSGDTLRIVYSLDRKADICVRVSVDGGPYTEPLRGLTGAVGKGVLPGDSLEIMAVSLPEIRGIEATALSFLVEVDDGALLVQLDSVSFRMMPVEGGSFIMGCTHPRGERHTYADELPTHKVTVNSFYIGQYEVTQRLWVAVM